VIATLAFYVGCRLTEDCLPVPRIMGSAVKVPAVAPIVAVLPGGGTAGHCRRPGGDPGRCGAPAAAGGGHVPAARPQLNPAAAKALSASGSVRVAWREARPSVTASRYNSRSLSRTQALVCCRPDWNRETDRVGMLVLGGVPVVRVLTLPAVLSISLRRVGAHFTGSPFGS